MLTVGDGAKPKETSNVEELKTEIKALKSANTKLVNKNEDLKKQIEELTSKEAQ